MRLRLGLAVGTVLLVLAARPVWSAPFAKTMTFEQPNGDTVSLWGKGDEFHAVFETLDGYTVTFDTARRGYCYAKRAPSGDLESSGELVRPGKPPETGIPKHLRMTVEAVRNQVKKRRRRFDPTGENERRWRELKDLKLEKAATARGEQDGRETREPPAFPTTGTKIGLCLLIDFDDEPATISQSEINLYCNGDSYTGYGNNGSVRQYFQDVSGGMLNYSNVVTAYVRVPNSLHPKSWYNDTTKNCGEQGNLLVRDALNILKARPDYNTTILPAFTDLSVDGANQVLCCNVFYAGGNGDVWMKALWPHSWALEVVGAQELSPGGKNIFRYQMTDIGNTLEIGTFCHENGHMMCGYPDIYDYGYDSKGGAGVFCLMGAGGHGTNPSRVCAYLRYKSGWCTATELDSTSTLTASLSATGAGANQIYRYAKPGVPTEYFLAENRQPTGRDASLPCGGIAVWHVDELGDKDNQGLTPNTTHANYECTLVQADNQWHFQYNINNGDAQDLYYAGNAAAAYANRLNDNSSPHAHWWSGADSDLHFENFSASSATMTFNVRGTGAGKPVIQAAPAGVTAALGASAVFEVAAVGTAPLQYRWQRDGVAMSDSGRITGTASARLTISNLQASDAAGYAVVVSNGEGSVTSAPPALLTPITSPQITADPQSLTVEVGNAAVFGVSAVGAAPLQYQWLRNGGAILGATNATHSIAAVSLGDAGTYAARVQNAHGSATSAGAVLTVVSNLTLAVALDTPGREWMTGGHTDWRGQSDTSHDGSDAAESGTVGDDEYSSMGTVVTGPAWLRFHWAVSSEEGYDYLGLWLDDTLRKQVSGVQDWTPVETYVPSGVHTMLWAYVKDESISRNMDRGWVDEVSVEAGAILTLARALDGADLAWTTGSTGGADPWYPVTDYSHDGTDAAESGYTVPDSSASWVETSVTGPGTLYFHWAVSSEQGYDGIVF